MVTVKLELRFKPFQWVNSNKYSTFTFTWMRFAEANVSMCVFYVLQDFITFETKIHIRQLSTLFSNHFECLLK